MLRLCQNPIKNPIIKDILNDSVTKINNKYLNNNYSLVDRYCLEKEKAPINYLFCGFLSITSFLFYIYKRN
jgi:hypothetical protein